MGEKLWFEPRHDKTNKMTCAASEGSEQSGHSPSLISLRCPQEVVGPWLSLEHTAKTDQTGRMLRLIWVFSGHTGHFVGFVVLRLIWFQLLVDVNQYPCLYTLKERTCPGESLCGPCVPVWRDYLVLILLTFIMAQVCHSKLLFQRV